MATGDKEQNEVERLLGTQEDSASSKSPGTFTRFFELEKVPPHMPSGASGLEPGPPGSYPPLSSARDSLNEDAPPIDTVIPTERTHVESGVWNDATSSPPNSAILRPDRFDGFFRNENLTEPARASTPGFGQGFSGADFLSFATGDQVTAGFNSAGERPEIPNDSLGTEPIALLKPHPTEDQQATHLFSSLNKPAADPVLPLQGPSDYTRVIDSSAQRTADEEKANLSTPRASVAPLQVPSAPVPVPAPQWPNQELYHYPPQASIPSVAAGVVPVPPQPVQPAEPKPQPAWMAYMPLIIGLNVLLFLAAILILVIALLPK